MKRILTIIPVIAVIVLVILNLTYKPGPEPDAVFPMANQNIEWYYAGK